ncbi:MAG: Mg2+/Co2+ transporter CorB [Flavobacteriales bacterium]
MLQKVYSPILFGGVAIAIVTNLVFLFNAVDLPGLTIGALITNVVVVLLSTVTFGFVVASSGEFRVMEFTTVLKELMKLVAPLTVSIGAFTYILFRFLAADLLELRVGEIREIWEAAGDFNSEQIEKGIANQKQWLSPFIQTTFFFMATLITGFFTSILVGLVAKKPGL